MADVGTLDLTKLKVADLKKLLKDRSLATTGNKSELIQRLQEAGQEAEAEDDIGAVDDVSDDVLNDVSDDVLKDDTEVVEELEEQAKEKEPEKPATVEITQKSPTPITAPEGVKVVATGGMTAEQRLLERSKRFGVVSAESKKKSRAERFGIAETKGSTAAVTGADMDKIKKRAERFGTVTSPVLSKEDSKEKLQKRAERFGNVTAPTVAKPEDDEKMLKRKHKFGVIEAPGSDAEAKKKKRAERFALA